MKRICNKPDLILDRQTGKLCQQFRTFLFDLLSPEYIPSDFTTGYYVDWKLLGKYHNCFNNKTYLIKTFLQYRREYFYNFSYERKSAIYVY